MKAKATEYLNQQFNTLISMYKGTLILESIKPKYEYNYFTYQNSVSQTTERSPMSQKYFNSCKQYLALFKSRSYHFLFIDYSIARFYYEFDNQDRLRSYNLLWFPCPFSDECLDSSKNNKYLIFEFLDSIQSIDKFQYDDFTFRTPIRIDFDAYYQGKKFQFHPTSHIHFQNKNTRAKNMNMFCLYKYFAFIIENCYPDMNYEIHRNEKIITRNMLNESNHWLKNKKVDNIDFGSNIHTN